MLLVSTPTNTSINPSPALKPSTAKRNYYLMSKPSDKQFEFTFDRKTEKGKVDPTPLLNLLKGRDWTLSKDLTQFNRRQLRSMANAAAGEIISGNRGYKLTLEEIQNFRSRMKSEITEMTHRILATDRVYHSYGHYKAIEMPIQSN